MFTPPRHYIMKDSTGSADRPPLIAYKTTVDADLKISKSTGELASIVCTQQAHSRTASESCNSVSPKWSMLQSLASFPHKEPARGRLRRNKQRSPVSQTDPLAFINDDAEDDFQCRYVETLRNRFVFGTATGKANNCLIDSLYQLAVVNNLSVERKSSTSDLFSDVRMELVHTYGAPEKDFLQHGLHGMPIMDILWNRMGSKKTRPPIAITAHSRQDVVCLPNRASYTNEDLLGLAGEIVFEDNYYTTLHLFNFNNTHYVPLIPK